MLFVSNNKVKDWPEVERLAALPTLEELLLVGNPLHADYKDRGALPEYRLEARHSTIQQLRALPYSVLQYLFLRQRDLNPAACQAQG